MKQLYTIIEEDGEYDENDPSRQYEAHIQHEIPFEQFNNGYNLHKKSSLKFSKSRRLNNQKNKTKKSVTFHKDLIQEPEHHDSNINYKKQLAGILNKPSARSRVKHNPSPGNDENDIDIFKLMYMQFFGGQMMQPRYSNERMTSRMHPHHHTMTKKNRHFISRDNYIQHNYYPDIIEDDSYEMFRDEDYISSSFAYESPLRTYEGHRKMPGMRQRIPDKKKINLSIQDKAEITVKVTEMVL